MKVIPKQSQKANKDKHGAITGLVCATRTRNLGWAIKSRLQYSQTENLGKWRPIIKKKRDFKATRTEGKCCPGGTKKTPFCGTDEPTHCMPLAEFRCSYGNLFITACWIRKLCLRIAWTAVAYPLTQTQAGLLYVGRNTLATEHRKG